MGCLLSTETAQNIKIEDGSNNVVIPICYFSANGGAIITGGSPLWKGAADETLTITSSGAVNHSVKLWGYEE